MTHRYVPVGSSGEHSVEEFLCNKPYSCEVILTNVSPQTKSFSLLYQIPERSLPLELTKYMKSSPFTLQPYTTNKLIFYFYFPEVGEYTHFPSSVSLNEKIVARAPTNKMRVVKSLSVSKKETFRDVL